MNSRYGRRKHQHLYDMAKEQVEQAPNHWPDWTKYKVLVERALAEIDKDHWTYDTPKTINVSLHSVCLPIPYVGKFFVEEVTALNQAGVYDVFIQTRYRFDKDAKE